MTWTRRRGNPERAGATRSLAKKGPRPAPSVLLPLLLLLVGPEKQSPAAPAPPPPSPDDSIVLIRTSDSLQSVRGSGFLVGDGGWVLTASHVVSVDLGKGRRQKAGSALVYSPWTGRPYEARVVAVDPVADVALLRLPEAGLPALPIEGMDRKEPAAALDALKERPLRLYGFPLSYGEATIAALAKPEHSDSKLREIARRDETSLCVLNACPEVQPGWSGGPMISADRGAVVAVFHSLYQPKAGEQGFPAGSISSYLSALLTGAGVKDLAAFEHPAAPTVAKAANAAERMAREMRSLSWSAAGNWKKAEEEQRELTQLAPADGLVHTELGRVLLAEKQYGPALAELKKATELAPSSLFARLELGRACHLNYDPKGALAALKAAADLAPGDPEPLLALAQVYEDNQKPDLAESTLRAALEKSPTHPAVLFRLGMLQIRQHPPGPMGADEGLKLLQQASELASVDPALSFIPLGSARALDNARRLKEAEQAYRQTLKVDPDNGTAYYYLAQLYFRQDRLEDAQIQLNAGIRVKSLSDDLLEAFRMLQARLNERGAGQ